MFRVLSRQVRQAVCVCVCVCARVTGGSTFSVTSAPPWTRFSFHTSLCVRSCQSQDAGPSACAPAAQSEAVALVPKGCQKMESLTG